MVARLQGSIKLNVRGKFFVRDGKEISVNAVTYGPFPSPTPVHDTEILRIVKAGFNAIRVYEDPTRDLLVAAAKHGVMVFLGVHWQWARVFRGQGCERYFTEAKLRLGELLERWGEHEAVVGCYVANEIPSDIARWIGPVKVRESLEELIDFCRQLAPSILVGYSNYPSSEYLEPGNADFTGFNIYLEDRGKFSSYLARLHHLSGDRPVMISEFGLDSKSHSVAKQEEVLLWARQEALDAGIAGTTLFAWSDRWRVGEREVEDWEFGLTDREGNEKFELKKISELKRSEFPMPRISVIICVYNGVERVCKAVESLDPTKVNYTDYEVIVVDDGSTDGTQEALGKYEYVKLVRAKHGGLSRARNLGAQAATGEIFAYTDDDCEVDPSWLYWIARGYAEQDVDALGGPNIPPNPEEEDEAVVAAAPGAPSHVMLNDKDAEHIPGCTLTVTREAFEKIGGFSDVYHAAGDDVDFCWRLENTGFKIGFHGAAFVWHRRRTSFYRYFKQQIGYGKAEALLMRDHPDRFTKGKAHWKGCVYTGAAMGAHEGSFVYCGEMGTGAYQQVITGMMPRRMLHSLFFSYSARIKLHLAEWLQPKVRHYARWWYSRGMEADQRPRLFSKLNWTSWFKVKIEKKVYLYEETFNAGSSSMRSKLLEKLIQQGWVPHEDSEKWDLHHKLNGEDILLVLETLGDMHWQLRARVQTEDRYSTAMHDLENLINYGV